MTIKTIQVGPIMTNCYLLCDEAAGQCALIDPGDDAARVEKLVQESGCALEYILLTHGHFDHTSAVRPLLAQHPDVPVYIHEKDSVDGPGGELRFIFSFSSSKIRRPVSLSASFSAWASVSSWVTPSRTRNPWPILPITCPSTVTDACFTLVKTALIIAAPLFLSRRAGHPHDAGDLLQPPHDGLQLRPVVYVDVQRQQCEAVGRAAGVHG